MDAQEMHDLAMGKRKPVSKDSRKKLEALLAKKSASSSQPGRSTAFDPIEAVMRHNPGLTREKTEEMAKAHGL